MLFKKLFEHESACDKRPRNPNLKSKTSQQNPSKPKNEKSSKWREEHNQFIQTLRIAKQMNQAEKEGGANADLKIAELRDKMPSGPDNRVECPHCGRKFNDSK